MQSISIELKCIMKEESDIYQKCSDIVGGNRYNLKSMIGMISKEHF